MTIRQTIGLAAVLVLASPVPVYAAGSSDPFDQVSSSIDGTAASVGATNENQEGKGDGAKQVTVVEDEQPAPSGNSSESQGPEGPSSTSADLPELLTILQPYCMGDRFDNGTGNQLCLENEQRLCPDEGSRYVVRFQYLTDGSGSLTRVGDPFCSDPAEPVVQSASDDDATVAPPMPVVTLADFRALDIAPSQIESDSGGFGLILANTNFYATEEPQTLNTTMLGQQVAIQAVPVQWTWDYGDGSKARSNPFPGGPQREFNQETTTSHVYEETGEFPVSLMTSYRGQFQVNGGPWIAIPGTAQVPSDPTTADIWRSKSKNVAENCVENPEGWACGNPFIED